MKAWHAATLATDLSPKNAHNIPKTCKMIPQLLLSISLFFAFSTAHQSIADPIPISTIRDCRIGHGKYCPGPCPRKDLRPHVTPDNPQTTIRRNGLLGVKTMKNNHVGGFARWSLVKVKDTYSFRKHRRNTFLYTCADVNLSKCNRSNKKDFCPGDEKNEYYQHRIKIPPVFDDGVYVLGFAWYGGLTREQQYGAFGDYYDCTYIRIKGGPIKGSHPVTFKTGRSLTARKGMCKAMVDRLGPCRKEFCRGNGPRGYRVGFFMKPAEFSGRSKLRRLRRVKTRDSSK